MKLRCQICNAQNEMGDSKEVFCSNCGTGIDFDSEEIEDQLGINIPNKSPNLGMESMSKRAITGITMIIVGGGITWLSYANAGQGETYVIWWGLCIYGAYLLMFPER